MTSHEIVVVARQGLIAVVGSVVLTYSQVVRFGLCCLIDAVYEGDDASVGRCVGREPAKVAMVRMLETSQRRIMNFTIMNILRHFHRH